MTLYLKYKKPHIVKDLQGNEQKVNCDIISKVISITTDNDFLTIISEFNTIATFLLKDLEMFMVVEYYGN